MEAVYQFNLLFTVLQTLLSSLDSVKIHSPWPLYRCACGSPCSRCPCGGWSVRTSRPLCPGGGAHNISPSLLHALQGESTQPANCTIILYSLYQNLGEILNIYENEFNKLSDRYFVEFPWPEAELISQVVDQGTVRIVVTLFSLPPLLLHPYT